MATITLKLPENGHMLWSKNNALVRTWDTTGSGVNFGVTFTDGYVASSEIAENPYFIRPYDGSKRYLIGGDGGTVKNWEGKSVYKDGIFILMGNDQVDSLTEIDVIGALTLTLEKPETKTEITIEEDTVTNCTFSPSEITPEESTTITATAKEGYVFNIAPYVTTNDGTRYNFTVSADKTTATLTQLFSDGVTSVTITATADKKETQIPITVGTVTNCTYTPTYVTPGERNTITITANAGYVFNTSPYGILPDGTRIVFTLSENNTVATMSDKYLSDSLTAFTITAIADPQTPKPTTEDYNPFISIFVPTLAQLKTLGNIAQVNPTSGEDLNLAQYIYGLYKVFIDVPTEKEEKNILLGKYNTNIKSEICNQEIIEMFSNSFIALPDSNSLYPVLNYPPHLQLKMFLPFIGVVDLNEEAIITIVSYGYRRIHYICNLLSLQCNAFIEVSPTGNENDYFPVQVFNGEIGYNYPFVQGKQYSKIDFNNNNIYKFTETNPRLIEIQDRAYLNGNDYIGYPIPHYEWPLNNLTGKGYFEISHVKLATNSQITENEKEELLGLLAGGVYF